MTLGEHQEKFSKDLVMLLQKAFELGYNVRIGEVQRTPEQQQIYIKMGRSKTENSMHINKCAADLWFMKDGLLVYPPELGNYWEELDSKNEAGMFWKTFKDAPHYERKV